MLAGYAITVASDWTGVPAAVAVLLKAYGLVFVTARNGLFEGFFYVALGMFVAYAKDRVLAVGALSAALAAVVGLAGCVLVSSDAHLPFCALYACGVFTLGICGSRPDGAGHPVARKTSTVIYLVHMYLVVLFVFGIMGYTQSSIQTPAIPHLGLYAFALGGSALLSLAVIALSRRLTWLRKVFGI